MVSHRLCKERDLCDCSILLTRNYKNYIKPIENVTNLVINGADTLKPALTIQYVNNNTALYVHLCL